MHKSINPTLLNRISSALRPDFIHTVLARRIAAGTLVLFAVVMAVRPDPESAERNAVVITRDLSPGSAVTADDIRLEQRPAGTLPDGTVTTLEKALGSTLTGPARRGEVLTDARILSSRLTELTAGRDARIVPLQLADSSVLDLIRPGDVVDVIGAPSADSESKPKVVASNAIVVLVSEKQKFAGPSQNRAVLVALPATAAHALAGATLVQTVTVTIH